MTGPPPPEPMPMLVRRARVEHGWTQTDLARQLAHASRSSTVTRHEVSRWERGVRVPGRYWRHWLAVMLGVPGEVLAAASEAQHAELGHAQQQQLPPAIRPADQQLTLAGLEAFADHIADRMLSRLQAAGSEHYRRDEPTDPGAGARRGARYGSVVNDSGEPVPEDTGALDADGFLR